MIFTFLNLGLNITNLSKRHNSFNHQEIINQLLFKLSQVKVLLKILKWFKELQILDLVQLLQVLDLVQLLQIPDLVNKFKEEKKAKRKCRLE